jgi:hypothetical protein
MRFARARSSSGRSLGISSFFQFKGVAEELLIRDDWKLSREICGRREGILARNLQDRASLHWRKCTIDRPQLGTDVLCEHQVGSIISRATLKPSGQRHDGRAVLELVQRDRPTPV